MRNDAVIFDIDGTLWNASAASAAGWNTALAGLGINRVLSAADIRSVTGQPYEVCVDILLPGLKTSYPGLIQALNECEMAAIKARGGEFFHGALAAVRELSAEFRVFLVSNCQQWYLDLFLGFSGLEPVLAGSDCHGKSGLPKAAMLGRMKSVHSMSSPIYIGDTAGDREAAAMAGAEFIHAAWGFGGPERGVKTVVSFTELREYLTRGNSAG